MRSTVILGLLAESDDPVRGRELWRRANEDERFQKAGGRDFWYEDFPWYMRGLVEQGVVTKVKERNKVWYVITEKGLLRYMKRNEPKEHRTFVRRRLRYHIGRYVHWQDEEREQIIAKLTKELVGGKGYVKQRYYRELVKDTAQQREWGYREADLKLVELVKEKIGSFDEEKFEADVQKLIDRRRRQVEKLQGFYAECFKCGRSIHRHEVVKVADELAERLGVETGNVCCACYDELIGGEVVAEIVT